MISLKLLSLVVACASIAVLPGELRAQPQPNCRPPQIKMAVFSHAQGGPAVIDRTRRSYPGRVEMGEDLMAIEIGDEVVVRRRGPGPLR